MGLDEFLIKLFVWLFAIGYIVAMGFAFVYGGKQENQLDSPVRQHNLKE